MKRIILLVSMLFLIVFSAASAQDNTPEPITIFNAANYFAWTDSADDVYAILAERPYMTVSNSEDESGLMISAELDRSDEYNMYAFHFDPVSGKLRELECLAIPYVDRDMAEYTELLGYRYELSNAGPYENDELEQLAQRFEIANIAAGPKTVCFVGANEATEERYGMLAVTFIDREYLESD